MVDSGGDIQAREELREVHHGASVKYKTGKGGHIHNDSQRGPNNKAKTNTGDNKAENRSDDLIHDDPTKEEGEGDMQGTRAGGGGSGGDGGEGAPGRCN